MGQTATKEEMLKELLRRTRSKNTGLVCYQQYLHISNVDLFPA